ncbi:MAG TPA: molybdenum cofactor biosynthesis protein MoaE [Acidimicrobiales bacterium]|nr:molybdenum cofactor biosynthesis protein MoaE [Acidimicrobiales bacterium]
MEPPAGHDDWLALTEEVLPLDAAAGWAVRPDCGAVVVFAGTVRDHAEGRPGVSSLRYEAYQEQVVPKLAAIADEARRQWSLGRIALLHRIGELALTECSVLVVVSSAHRAEAFDGARFCIEAIKASVPIWKEESWEGGQDWGTGAKDVVGVEELTR